MNFFPLPRLLGGGDVASNPANYLVGFVLAQWIWKLETNFNSLRWLNLSAQDEDDWESANTYEGLLRLSARIGEVRPKHAPAHVIASLPTCLYSHWRGGSCKLPDTPPVSVSAKGKGVDRGETIFDTAGEAAGAGAAPADGVTSKDTQCAICLEKYASLDMLMSAPCSHAFHETCLKTWLESARTCPCCRGDVCDGSREQIERNASLLLPELSL